MSEPKINTWQTDPGSGSEPTGGTIIQLTAPDLTSTALATQIVADMAAPPAKTYPTGTEAFRYWNLASALSRGSEFWRHQLQDIPWRAGNPLPVHMDKGVALESKYDRKNLKFYHAPINDHLIYTCESPELIWHEMGHAILDSIKPQLWDVPGFEIAAFHESFGDISAMLCNLQSESMRNTILAETKGKLYSSSKLSRFAEQLGWAKRQKKPTEPDADCLRNAINPFSYKNPLELPLTGTFMILSSEPHSLSKVFTGAFLEGLANMFKLIDNNNNDEKNLLKVSIDMATIFIKAVKNAVATPTFFSAVGVAMINYAGLDFQNINYRQALGSAFVRHGIISLNDYFNLVNKPLESLEIHDAGTSELTMEAIPVAEYGLGVDRIYVYSQDMQKVAPVSEPKARGMVSDNTPATEYAKKFIENLLMRGQLKINEGISELSKNVPTRPNISTEELSHTHELQKEGDGYVLKRMYID